MTYLRAYASWLIQYGNHRAAKRYARSESILARKQRAERQALRGLNT